MKIVHVITALSFGGAEKLLVNLANLQVKAHQVNILYLKNEAKLKPLLDAAIVCQHLPINRNVANALRQKIKELRPDVVHTHLGHADLLGLWACRGLRLRLFCTMHNIWFKWNWKDQVIFSLYAVLLRTVARHCQVICISKVVEEHVRGRLGVPSCRTHLIYNAIPHSTYEKSREEARQEVGLSEGEFCLLFVGRLSLQKSVDTLLQAVALLKQEIPALRVLIIGEGPLQTQLEQLSKALKLKGITEFRGATFFPDQYFASADVFVLPSVFEGMGIVLLEAFRSGLPIVASDVEGPKELIQPEGTGLLFKPKDPIDLAKQIKRLYKDQDLRIRLGQNGKAAFGQKYEMKHYARQVETLYQSANKFD